MYATGHKRNKRDLARLWGGRFERELEVPGFEFAGTQLSSFSEANLLGASTTMDWVMGLNLWTQDFENMTDTRQTRYGPLYSGTLANPVFDDI